MKSCFGMILAILILVAVIGTLGGIYYLSSTTEFSAKQTTSPWASPLPRDWTPLFPREKSTPATNRRPRA